MAPPELVRFQRVLRLRALKRDEAAQGYATALAQWRQLQAQVDELTGLAEEYNAQFSARTAAASADTQALQGMHRFYGQVTRLRDQQQTVVARAAVARDQALAALTQAQTELLAMETVADKRELAHKKAQEKKAERARIPPRPRTLV